MTCNYIALGSILWNKFEVIPTHVQRNQPKRKNVKTCPQSKIKENFANLARF